VIHKLDIAEPLLLGHGDDYGKNCFVAYNPALTRVLQQWTQRDKPDLCLKVFAPLAVEQDPETFQWSGTTLVEATKAQNLFAYHGLAPRVYALVLLNGERLAQVTRYASGAGDPDIAKAKQIARKYKIASKGHPDMASYIAREPKWVGSSLVDFGEFYFADPSWYEAQLQQHVIRYHKKPHLDEVGYQDCEELGVAGRRKMAYRKRIMKLDEVDFRGHTVLDIGCNNGAFCREAARRGAARVVGVDHKFAEGNRELANWLGYWNVDFLQAKLPGDWKRIRAKSGLKKFDIVLCLSVAGHVGGYASWIPGLVGDMMWFSGQSVEPRSRYQSDLDRDFERVEWLGYERDEMPRKHPLWRVWNVGPDQYRKDQKVSQADRGPGC